jgi:hypothetical protein
MYDARRIDDGLFSTAFIDPRVVQRAMNRAAAGKRKLQNLGPGVAAKELPGAERAAQYAPVMPS